jgi:hypothetical protein
MCRSRLNQRFFRTLLALSNRDSDSRDTTMASPPHFAYTYNDVHNIIKSAAPKIAEFKPDMFIAIGEHQNVINFILGSANPVSKVEGQWPCLCIFYVGLEYL